MNKRTFRNFTSTLLVLAAIIGFLFAKSCQPEQMLFSSDGPLGALAADAADMSTGFKGYWIDLNWLGIEGPAALPHTSSLVSFLFGTDPVPYLKFHVPIALVCLGLSLWFLLRQFGFHHAVCAIAAIAAALNMNTFSHAAWGLPSRAWTLASTFLAIAALANRSGKYPFLKALLAGLAVSNGIMEGFDVGAIFSLYVAAFGAFLIFAQPGPVTPAKVTTGLAKVALVAVFAAICSAAALSTLIGTQIQGIAGMEQDAQAKEQRWDAATMWSLPKSETARVIVPGLFGYRMDTEEGGNYWGAVGQTPGVPQSRHSGAGEYAGALVVLVAAFGIANAFRKKGGPYTDFERRIVYFFAGAALICVLLAWGRHAPFYKLVYSLPYFSTIRNPIKFMHPFHMCVLILFGFGLEAVFRLYVKETETKAAGLKTAIASWWKTAPLFERRWTFASLGFVALLFLGTLIFISSERDLIRHLATGGFPQAFAEQISGFARKELGYSILFFALGAGLLVAALSGWFSGQRARWLVLAFGLLIAVDLARANSYWVNYYNYKDRYATNPIIEFLRQDAHEHRVTARLAPFSGRALVDADTGEFAQVANIWLQHHFQYYNIQSLEPVQMPRPPELDQQFFLSMIPGGDRGNHVLTRMWELSNTRYLIGDKNLILGLAPQIDPGQQRFRLVKSFDMQIKPGVAPNEATLDDLQWIETEAGRFALVEFTGALPRAKLYPSWEESTSDTNALQQLTSAGFNPATNAFLHGDAPISPAPGTNFTGAADITKYAPKHIEITVSNSAPALLVYNDKFTPNWKLTVNGKPETLYRANFIMRGIPLPAGTHSVVMTYEPPLTGLYISFAGIAAGLLTLGFVAARTSGRKET